MNQSVEDAIGQCRITGTTIAIIQRVHIRPDSAVLDPRRLAQSRTVKRQQLAGWAAGENRTVGGYCEWVVACPEWE